MQAINIGKTILVWDNLSESEVQRVIKAIEKLINTYRNLTNQKKFDRVIPVPLFNRGNYLSILYKHNEIIVSSTRNKGEWKFNPIINCDQLFKNIELIENYDMKQFIDICNEYPDTKWIQLPYNQAFETYSLSPNINPQDFIKHLQNNTLSDFQKKFLKDVGISLDNPHFSKSLQDTIKKANDLFEERD